MYDTRQEPNEFIGSARNEAIEKACAHFGVSESDLRINELGPGQVSGLGDRIVVVAVPRNVEPRPSRPERSERGGRSDGGRREGGRRERGGSGRDRDRGRRERRDSRPSRDDRDEPEAAPPPPAEPSVGKADGELGEIGAFVLGLVERMQLGGFEISEQDEEGLIAISVTGAAAPRLSGRDGRTVDAIQLLANQVASQTSEDPMRVVIDVEGDSDARESRLEQLAERVASRARETGRAVRLDPMNGRDRRTIHLALREADGIATMSSGEGRYRQVLVVPEGAPEYDDAVREAEAANRARD